MTEEVGGGGGYFGSLQTLRATPRLRELAAADDLDLGRRLARARAQLLNSADEVLAGLDLAKDDVLAVQPGRLDGGDAAGKEKREEAEGGGAHGWRAPGSLAAAGAAPPRTHKNWLPLVPGPALAMLSR